MTRAGLVGLLVAAILSTSCGSPRATRRTPTPRPEPTGEGTTSPPSAPTSITHKPRAIVEAPHAGAIQLLTATPEGDAVLSVDDLGGVRLWPRLDGTQEPALVELSAAKDLALGHRGDGYTAVVRDETGGLYIAKLDAHGRTLAHATLGVDPPFAGIVMTSAGLVAWRADHHVLLLDNEGTGAIKGDIATEPQQRIVDIAARGRKALALLETDGKRKARWLTLQPRLAWGAWIEHPDADRNAIAIALAPHADHFALALKDEKSSQVAVYDAAKGTRTNIGLVSGTEMDLAFIDGTLLAISSSDRGLTWLSVRSSTSTPAVPPGVHLQPSRQRHVLAAGAGGTAVIARDGDLILATQTQTKFLGYASPAPQLAAPGPNGSLLVVAQPGPLLLDANLAPHAAPAPQLGNPRGSSIAALEWLDGDHWLVEATAPTNNTKLTLAITNIVTGASTTVRDNLAEVHYLTYEPSTKLVTLSLGKQAQVARLDLAGKTLDQLGHTPKRKPFEEAAFAPLAPTLARGHELVDITIHDKPTLRWFKSASALDTPSSSITVTGSYLGTDAAGRVYIWQPTPHGALEVAIYTDGKQTGTFPTQNAAALWPDPTATLVAEASAHGVTLYRGATPVWTRPVEGVHEIHWLTDGALALTHATGIARLDARTGAVTAMRCGWQFGLSDNPHPPAPRIEPICAQLAN